MEAREYLERAIFLMSCHKYEEALGEIRMALTLEPDHAGAYYYAARSSMELGRYDEAEQYARASVAANPDIHYGHDILSQVLRRMRRHEEALPHCLRVIELDPDEPNHYAQAATLFHSKDPGKSLELADRGLRVDPSDCNCLFARCLALRNLGRREEAIRDFEKVLTLQPENFNAMTMLGWEEYEGGNVARAAELFRRALEVRPDFGLALHLLETEPELAGAVRNLN